MISAIALGLTAGWIGGTLFYTYRDWRAVRHSDRAE